MKKEEKFIIPDFTSLGNNSPERLHSSQVEGIAHSSRYYSSTQFGTRISTLPHTHILSYDSRARMSGILFMCTQ